MCLAVPVKIVSLSKDRYTAVVDAGGVRREANVAMIEEPQVGDYILLHAGFAIQKWSTDDVKEYNEIIQRRENSSE
ncbi:MAG TPA: HypC/HybG/HupF family hydrogenase formation chaperone [Candidatus Krumholzibacteriaceae bacterium]|nr:HypC/HybG/HupF family hydrogenase formation chaperone [Candidatus Krumholzibacteriaceae bacterium]